MLAIAAALAGGCTSVHATQRTFAGTQWRVTAIDGQPLMADIIRFGTDSVEGGLGCNSFGGFFRVANGWLLLTRARTTERGCVDPDVAAAEERAFAIIGRPMAIRWHSAQRLTLSNEAGSLSLHRIN
jgi:heat shock protein HslJ